MSLTDGVSRGRDREPQRERERISECPLLMVCLEGETGNLRMSLTDGVSREGERQGISECPLLMVCLERERDRESQNVPY